jgi:hypothetical protein
MTSCGSENVFGFEAAAAAVVTPIPGRATVISPVPEGAVARPARTGREVSKAAVHFR